MFPLVLAAGVVMTPVVKARANEPKSTPVCGGHADGHNVLSTERLVTTRKWDPMKLKLMIMMLTWR